MLLSKEKFISASHRGKVLDRLDVSQLLILLELLFEQAVVLQCQKLLNNFAAQELFVQKDVIDKAFQHILLLFDGRFLCF